MPTPDTIAFAYGDRPHIWTPQPGDRVTVAAVRPRPALEDWRRHFLEALKQPVGSPPLGELLVGKETVGIVVGDRYRDGPKQAMVEVLLEALRPLPPERVTLFIANGTHPPGPLAESGLDPARLPGVEIINHDGTNEAQLEYLGVTRRRTPVFVNRAFLECDLRLTLGQMKPHYFAGLSGGAKGVFPGLGGTEAIEINHRLKRLPGARLGNLQGNPVREDLEEIAEIVGVDCICDVVLNDAGAVADLECGHVVAAHRALAERSLPWWEVPVRPSDVVIVSAGFPLAKNLYQACKLIAVGGWCLKAGGTLVLAAECPEGTGPIDAVNHRIFRDGVSHFLPEGARVVVVSAMEPGDLARTTFAGYAPTIDAALADLRPQARRDLHILAIPKAGNVIPCLPPPSPSSS